MDDDRRDRTLWCGNLDSQVTEELLRELFVQAGPVEDVKIPKDNTGRTKSFAFITFEHAESVGYTLALMDGVSLYGRPIRMERRPQATVDNKYLDMMARYYAYRDSIAVQSSNMYNCADDLRPSFAPPYRGAPRSHVPMGMPMPYQPGPAFRGLGGVPPGSEYCLNSSDRYPPTGGYDRYGRSKDRHDRRYGAEPYGRHNREFWSEKEHRDTRGMHRGPGRYDRRHEEEQRYSRSDHRRDYHERRRQY